jgi:hypothetical protein
MEDEKLLEKGRGKKDTTKIASEREKGLKRERR